MPGALQGLLPCFVRVSHCNFNLYLIAVFNSYQDVLVGKKKKEKKKNINQDLAILFLKQLLFILIVSAYLSSL
tara:strand:- start:945 stop:1163 length:219 start_codon:yes stop_codon:yes gene_type:complete